MVVMFMFVVTPVGYGWGFRGWGPPYPRYVQRRRGAQAVAMPGDPGGAAAFNHHSWGWTGDLVWMVLVVGMFWAVFGLWWR